MYFSKVEKGVYSDTYWSLWVANNSSVIKIRQRALFGLAQSSVLKTPTNLQLTAAATQLGIPHHHYGISSVSIILPYPIRKSRYLSSDCYPVSPHTIRLIIGRSKAPALLGPSFSISFKEL